MKRFLPLPLLLLAVLVSGCQPQSSTSLLAPVDATPQWEEAPVRKIPSSIDATGKTDVSQAFASFLSGVPDGTTIELTPNGRYRMESTLLVANRNRLTFEGNGATFFATTQGDRVRSNVRVRGGSHIAFRNLVVKGANPDAGKDGVFVIELEAQHAFDVIGVTSFVLDKVRASDLYGDFVHFSHWNKLWTNGVVIRDSHFERSGRSGISFVAVRNVIVENNSFDSLRRATFNFEPERAASGIENVVIRNNRIGVGRLNFVAASGAGPVGGITIDGNRLSGQALQVYIKDKDGGRRKNWKILNNRSDLPFNAPHKSVMRIWRVDGLEIRGNRQPFSANAGMYGANIDSSCGLAVTGNDFPNSIGQANVTGTCPTS